MMNKNKLVEEKITQLSNDKAKLNILFKIQQTPYFKLLSRNIQDFYTYLILIHLEGLNVKDEKNLLSQYFEFLGFQKEDSTKIIECLYPHLIVKIDSFIQNTNNSLSLLDQQNLEESTDFNNFLYLSSFDIDKISQFIKDDQDKFPPEIFKLLISFAAFSRANFHPNGWIKYDQKSKDYIFYLASVIKKDQKYKEYLTNTLHLIYNLNMRVVGSTQPIPCFQLGWQEPISSPETGASNYLVMIGENSPESIDNFFEFLQNNNSIDLIRTDIHED